MGAWFEDSGFWEVYAPLMFDEKRWAEVPTVVSNLESLVGLSPGSRVLDACCGPGRHSLEFARRGYAVTGVDLTESYLEAAQETAAAEGLAIEFLHEDIRFFRRVQRYDLCINLFTSFGYFPSRAEDLMALRNFRESLVPGGALVIEMIGKETAVRDFVEGEWFERAGWTVCTEYQVVGDWEGLRNRWLLIKDDQRIDRSFVQRLYSAVEFESILLEAGFKTPLFFGSLEGSPYDEKATSLVALARA